MTARQFKNNLDVKFGSQELILQKVKLSKYFHALICILGSSRKVVRLWCWGWLCCGHSERVLNHIYLLFSFYSFRSGICIIYLTHSESIIYSRSFKEDCIIIIIRHVILIGLMSHPSSLSELQDYFNRLHEYGITHAVQQELLQDIWGEPRVCPASPEENASFVSQYLYSWIYPYALKASQENIKVQELPVSKENLQVQTCGRKLSRTLQLALYNRNAWSSMIGCPVCSRRDADSRGILRWIGVPQQGKYTRIMAGIEWTQPPKFREVERDTAGANNPFFDGVAYGEHLFHTDSTGMSTLEDPVTLELMVPKKAALPPPPVPKRVPLFRCIIRTLPGYVVRQVPFVLVSMALGLCSPLLLKAYVAYIGEVEYRMRDGVLIVLGMAVTYALNPLLRHRGIYMSMCAGVQFRAALSSLIFEKCMTMSIKPLATPSMNAGRIVNMLSSDVERSVQFLSNFDMIWSSPLQLVIAVMMLYSMVGWCSLVGLVIFATSIPLNTYLMSIIVSARRTLSALTDARVRGTNEFISGIRVAKFMSWEPRFISTIEQKRHAELQQLRKIQLCRVLMSFLNNTIPNIMIATVFIMYYLMGNELTATVVFPTISLFSMITGPFMEIPMIITMVIQFKVSLERLKCFLECENTPHTTVRSIEGWREHLEDCHETPKDAAVVIENAEFSAYVPRKIAKVPKVSTPFWRRLGRFFLRCSSYRPARERPPLVSPNAGDREGTESIGVVSPTAPRERIGKQQRAGRGGRRMGPLYAGKDDPEACYELDRKVLLREVNIELPRGKLTVVVGPTGCGKSTLMQSLLSQLEVSKGRVWATKSIAYVPQQPWIMNATVRENVLFFSEERDEPLREALRVSQLETDLGLMANGLETEIGEKGINLSGGQKARVSLARAVYADREMYLLDDPLSALDAHVGDRVLKECLLGALDGKTRVLATHHLHVLQHADYVIALADQQVAFCGTREDFLHSAAFRSLDLASQEPMARKRSKEELLKSREASEVVDSITRESSEIRDNDEEGVADEEDEVEEEEAEAQQQQSGRLMTDEEKAVGSVPLTTYKRFMDFCGGVKVVVGVLLLFVFTEVLGVASMVWLSLWTADAFGLPMSTYLKWYLVAVLLGRISAPLRILSAYTVMRRGSIEMHKAVLRSVASSTMGFFDTTPVGRILQRFSRDIDVVDNTLQMALIGVAEMSMGIVSSMIISVVSLPIFAITLPPLFYFYYRIMGFYGTASREARRLTSIVKSPVYSLLGEITSGMSTIEAYHASSRFMAEAARRLDIVTSCNIFGMMIHRWLGVRVQLVNAAIITFIAAVGLLSSRHNGSDTAMIALSLTMVMQTTGTVLRLLRQSVMVETEMNSVERLVHYIENIPHEPILADLEKEVEVLGGPHTPSGKPTVQVVVESQVSMPVAGAGSLEFRNVQMRYREGLPLVLRDVTFCIAPREKVGVVGRTGSGKSTLMLTFMRMVDICGGEILVNGSGIRLLPIRELRKQFSMIPQDPVLFEGTVRQNMDPFEEATDTELWEALSLCGLKDRIESEPEGLDGHVLEGGSNFSVGQRQLLCMSRALLRKGSRFILMDEATANIDPQLDRHIQSTVRTAFAAYTVITIAHRLHTVANYDKIIVMDQGVVAETGTPRELVSNQQSIFRSMVLATGEAGMNEFMRLLK
eukprot:gene8006-5564_t